MPLLPLATAAILAVQGVEVTASVDRTHITVGQAVMLTIRAQTKSAEPVEIILPTLTGFSIVGSRDLTEVAIGGSARATRTIVRELQLRAEQPGTLMIGHIGARQGRSLVSTDFIMVTVDSAADRVAMALSPIARSLLEEAPPPTSSRADRVALTVLVPSDTVLAGQQVDIIAAAWIPRELRERMRRAPLLTLATPERVWAYPPTNLSGIAMSKQVGGRWMDLFVAHQIVFPLAAGRLLVPPASVEYALPVTFSFFSREERYTLRSDTVSIIVQPLPPTGPKTTVVAESLRLDLRISPAATRVGEPVETAVTVNGVGNVALWPEPVLRWPTGFRTYPAQTEVRVSSDRGRTAGSKTFRFLAVPDSAGSFVLPDVHYPYFDLASGRYEDAVTAPRVLAVAPGAEPRAARVLPPLMPRRGVVDADALNEQIGPAGWLAILLIPPVLAWLLRKRDNQAQVEASESRRSGTGGEPTRLGNLEREFLAVLSSHVSDPFARDGDGLAQALRASGVDSAVADHVKRLRDRLRAARYGPRGLGDAAELAAEIEQVLRVMGADGPGAARRRRPVVIAALMGVVLLAPQHAVPLQAPSAEALYQAGALRAAADSFAARAAREPREPAHWYNLGATAYRAGSDGKATVAWTLAARLAPRDAVIRRARLLLPPPDPGSEQLLRVGWATPAECALIAASVWVVFWVVAVTVGNHRRRVLAVVFGAMIAIAGFSGGNEWLRRQRSLAVVVAESAPVRAAPYGVASAAVTVPAGGAVIIGRRYGPWREVRRKDGLRGWMLQSEVVPL
jgi:hypothetical protein